METRTIEVTLISARDIQDANLFTKSKLYAVAWIKGDLRPTKQRTVSDKENGTKPTWNKSMTFTVDEAALQQGRLVLEVEIRTEGTFGDKEVGHVSVPMKEFLNKKPPGGVDFVAYQVRKPSGKAKGTLNLSVKLNNSAQVKQPVYEPTAFQYPTNGSAAPAYGSTPPAYGASAPAPAHKEGKNEPVTAYPAYPPTGSSSSSYPPPAAYPPPPPGPTAGYPHHPPPPPAGYPQYPPPGGHYPPQQGYPPYNQGGYPPYNQGGYPPYNQGYPPVQQRPPKKNKMGMGLGAGLLGGALGGLLIGDMVSDGFDDGGDFGGGDFGGDF